MTDHKLNKNEAFQAWVRQTNTNHQTALINLQNWFFALARCCKVEPADLAKAIMDFGPQSGFGRNLQMRLKEETDKAVAAEKEKLNKESAAAQFAPPALEEKGGE